MEKLDHQPSEAFEGPRYSHAWANFDEHTLCCVYEDLELSSFVDGRVKESK